MDNSDQAVTNHGEQPPIDLSQLVENLTVQALREVSNFDKNYLNKKI